MSNSTRSLLIVDDDTAMREMLASLFQEQSYETIEASSANAALDLAKDAEFDVSWSSRSRRRSARAPSVSDVSNRPSIVSLRAVTTPQRGGQNPESPKLGGGWERRQGPLHHARGDRRWIRTVPAEGRTP